jgi:signal transduction histidine kinase
MDTLFMVKEYLALSDYFSAAGRLDSSYYYLDIGEHIAVRAELASERIDAEEIRASKLIQEGHFREAIAHARKALKMSERENQSLKKTELYKILQTAFDSIGDSQQAYHYFRKYAALKDSVYTSRTYFTAQELTDYQKLKATEEAFTVKVATLNQSKQKTVLLSSVAIIAALMLLFFTWRYFKKKEGHTMRFLISKLNKLGKPGQASERLEELLPAGISEMKELSGELQRLQDMINEEGGAAKATAHQEDIDTMVKEKIEYLEGLQFSISHDLKRYVLNLQNQLSQLVSRNQPLSPSEVAPVQKITEEMILFMEQLKEIHRIDELSIQASYINLQDLVKDVLQQLSPEQNYPGVQIDLRGELPTVETDPLLARQVITNLLENALKYSQNSAQPRVEIGLTNKGRETALYVRDNGEGIPDDDQSRIFEPFYRSSHTKVEGTGLGLAISRIAAQKLGGGLRVESRLGQGSTFIFALSA